MEVFKFFDAYSLRARLFPAIIAAAPAFAALALLISWKSFALSNLIAGLGIIVLLFAIADFARSRGRAIEKKLYDERGGTPSILMFRRSDATIDAGSKDRYREFLAGKIGVAVPSDVDEAINQVAADAFYGQCGIWLRQMTRDTKKFSILFGENVTYGFRRNLLGLKAMALSLNAIVVAVCAALLWQKAWDFGFAQSNAIVVVLIVAAAHAAYMIMAVTRSSVWDASRAYGRELIISTESFISQASPARKTAPRKTASKKPNAVPPEQP